EIDLVNLWKGKMDRHKQQLQSMSAADRKKPAYVVWSGSAGTDDLNELTGNDDSRGQELWTINPDYFNKSLPPTAIQIIVIKPDYSHVATPFIKAKVMDIFNAIDYKALRALIQN